MQKEKATKKVHIVSLGCPKNRVDSEVMLGRLEREGYESVASPEGADLVLVNTCAFIDAAKEESVDAIVEMGALKKSGDIEKLVVAGCLSQRYAPDLAKEIPEVDHFLGTGNFEHINEVVSGHPALPVVAPKAHPRTQGRNALKPYRHESSVEGREISIPDPDFTLTSKSPRANTTAAYSRYVKVSEGCSNTCAFCIIPKLRGPQRSRTIEDIVAEVSGLLDQGVVELNLIAQDLCAYGKDLEPKVNLEALLRALDQLCARYPQETWIRCMYAYPRGLSDGVIELLAEDNNVVPYLDMPLQHVSDDLLRTMKRGKGGPETWALVRKLRKTVPDLKLRTTFITGLPGETEEHFQELLAFVREIKFDHMGVFAYSPEEDTPAATMAHQVDRDVAETRKDTLMAVQAEIARDHQDALVGTQLQVLVEGVSDETDLLLEGRYWGQAPEIDGKTYITDGIANPGDVITVEIAETSNYDIAGGRVA